MLMGTVRKYLGVKDTDDLGVDIDLGAEFLAALHECLPATDQCPNIFVEAGAEDFRIKFPAMRQAIKAFARFMHNLTPYTPQYFQDEPPNGAGGIPITLPTDVPELLQLRKTYSDDAICVCYLKIEL